jgi:hypothetical protein
VKPGEPRTDPCRAASHSGRLTATVLAAVLLGSGCSGSLQFRNDRRIEITSPEDRSTVTVPFAVEWMYEDFEVTGPTPGARDDAGYFGVFVDRAPMPAGEDFHWLVRDDRSCEAEAGCPDERYLADRDIFTTTKPRVEITKLPKIGVRAATEVHDITVVLLDGSGRRIGESAWYVDVRYEREDT